MTLSLSSRFLAWLLAPALLSAWGCLSTGTPELRQDVEALRTQVASLLRGNEDLEAELEALREARSAPDTPSTEVAALDARIVSLETQISALRQQLDDTRDRLSVLSLDVQSARELALRAQPPRLAPSAPPEGEMEAPPVPPEGPGPEGPVPAPPEGPGPGVPVKDSYGAAYADFTRGNYDLAITGFEEFLARHPEGELSDNAQFWIAESYFSQGDYEIAAEQYDRVIERYPGGDRVPAAYLKKGLCLMEMDQVPEGVVLLQHLIQTYPTSEEAALARDRLQGMGVKP